MTEQETAWVCNPHCAEVWPECESGKYDPRCCRFPKSCSCMEPAEDLELTGAELVAEHTGRPIDDERRPQDGLPWDAVVTVSSPWVEGMSVEWHGGAGFFVHDASGVEIDRFTRYGDEEGVTCTLEQGVRAALGWLRADREAPKGTAEHLNRPEGARPITVDGFPYTTTAPAERPALAEGGHWHDEDDQ